MSERLKILLVEDSEPDAELVLRELRHATLEHESRRVDTQADFERELKAFRPDVILSDFSMPRFSGMEALAICRQLNIDVPFIFVSATIGEDAAIKAMKAGAHDYVMKGNLARLVPAVQRSEEHTSELQSPDHLVCRLLLEKKKKKINESRLQSRARL